MDEADALEQYFCALGAFIHEFSQVENLLQLTAWVLSGVDASTARVLFKKLQVDTAINTVRDLSKSKGKAAEPLGRGLSQLKKIADRRNAIVHRGANFTPTGPILSPRLFADNKLPDESLSAEILKRMTHDLSTIERCLLVPIMEGQTAIPERVSDIWKKAAYRDWRYHA